MVYKLEKNEEGNVRDKNGVRYNLIECRVVYSPAGVNVGFTEFPTRSSALAFYGVEDIPEEEMFQQENTI